MAKKSKKGIIMGVVAACAVIGALTPDKEAESTELSVPAYQAEYDIDTEVPVDDPTSDEAVAKVEEQKIAEEQAAREAEEQKAAEEQAAREAEEQKVAEEKAAKEAEEQKAAEEQAAREAEEQKVAEEKAAKEAEEQKLLAAQSEKANLPDTSVSDTAAQSEPVQPKETAVVEETPAPEESVATPVGEMVWLSATGEKYHRINNCGRMNPNKARQVTLEDAINSGYDRCSKCW